MSLTRALTAKLKSKAGVSMVMALVFLLLCSMVGVVVLSAASVSLGKLSRERQYYRQTLALTSAARLLSDQLQKMTYTGGYVDTETVTITVSEDAAGKPSTKVEKTTNRSPASSTLSDSPFHDAMLQQLDLLCKSKIPKLDDSVQTKVTLPPISIVFQADENRKIPEVTAILTLDEDYGIRITLTCMDKGEENSMILVFRPLIKESIAANEPVETNTTDDQKTTITKTEYLTTVTWVPASITEGDDAA